ncbi:zinc ribbon domain-containing protein [Streptomyces sp. NBC_01485]|uniref:Zn-ribbon domain-containing OB-fold protein n=1 Tax=Streptomyces sp. NBC_01485 TaxID=2903884 RepID=UPI002E30E56E|nr:zinc ribbon domain-containing protein [Streptomyces sp. NBC_01485]
MLETVTLDLEHTERGEGHEAAAAATSAPLTPNTPADCGELLFQRCLWCGTPDYRRSFCRACGSRALRREPSAGDGVVLRRQGQVPHNTWFVAMNEGFNLLCRATGTPPVAVGSRVSVVRAGAPLGQGLPVVEPTRPPTSDRSW